MRNILLIGSGAREHAIARAIKKSSHPSNLFCVASNNNPGIAKLCKEYSTTPIDAIKHNIDFAIIGPEAALAAGVVDELAAQNIPSIGPTKQLAKIETSKGFARDLLTKYDIFACPKYKIFNQAPSSRDLTAGSRKQQPNSSLDPGSTDWVRDDRLISVKEFLHELGNNYVIKADGLKGGKGVKISDEHLFDTNGALNYCQQLIIENSSFVIE
ncbi:MAG: hypothetical protein V3W20_14675, partial [Candidatus Neomarinimicrobiota bacterium]